MPLVSCQTLPPTSYLLASHRERSQCTVQSKVRLCLTICLYLQPIRRLLDEKFPDMQRIETSSLHKGVAGARHTFLKQQPGQDKLNLLLQVSCY